MFNKHFGMHCFFYVLGTNAFGVITAQNWKLYGFKTNALLESCKNFAWSPSLCIMLLKCKVKDDDDVKAHYDDPLWGVTFY
jgi:hypothetical protein